MSLPLVEGVAACAATPPMFLYQLALLLEPVVPTGKQYGPDPLDLRDLVDWIDLAD